jgi:methylenetetrahydrofolate dehydrogenase (NADP+)/methenyltetrahydrofolate cyclohydrolase
MTEVLKIGNAVRLDGKKTARAIREEVARGVADLAERRGVRPGLTVLLVGDDPASAVYVRNKEKFAGQVGMDSVVLRKPVDTSEDEILAIVDSLNRDPAVHGILVQLPLPDHVDSQRVIERIDPDKDVDGFHPVSAGRLSTGLSGFVPCTPAGILELLKRYEIPLKGQRAVVVGRSNIVGKPMALLLLREHCTVTLCHSRTRDLPAVCSEADILVAAIGRRAMITGEYIRPGAVVVDVGMNTVTDEKTCLELFGDDPKRLKAVRERGSTLVGDVHPLDAAQRAGWFTPVPGGVGPLTIAMLLRNTLGAAQAAAER